MMVGELEYQDTFYGGNDDAMSNGGPLVGHLLYVLFVIIVAILLMNLLVALTVSDVQVRKRQPVHIIFRLARLQYGCRL